MKENILITGASSGVGLSLSHYLSKRFHVIAIARRLDKMRKEFEGIEDVSLYRADLANQGEAEGVLDEVTGKHGDILHVINNAGVNIKASLEELTFEKVMQSLQVNAISPILMLRKLMPRMKEKNFGRIINLTSGAPLNCFPQYGAYSASKGTLNAFTVTAAKECASFNIKINLMSPGPVRTEMAPNASMDPSACHPTVDYLLSIDEKGPTGRFFWLGYEIPLFPNLEGIEWLEGRADNRYRRVI
jgi:3-oxoacyl-[acyl-carrier protein] reductase